MSSDATLNRFLGYGTDAARSAFTPAPPTPASGPSPLYAWWTSDTKHLWVYDSSWHDLGLFDGSFSVANEISPTSLSTNQNDYSPTNLATAGIVRQDCSANVNITGLATGAAKRIVIWENISAANTQALQNQNASSAAANRFITSGGTDVTLSAGGMAILVYDITSSRWRVFSGGGGGGGAGTVTSVATDGTYLTGGPITTTGTVSPTTLTESAVDSALHTLCGGI